MSTRRINSTGRKKILREDIRIVLHRYSGKELAFRAQLELSEYNLPHDALVFVEAHRQASFMRFAYGTVDTVVPSIQEPIALTEFATPAGLRFSVKVTSAGTTPGLLLAEGEGIPVTEEEEEPDRRMPLLPPKPEAIGQEVWRLDFSDASGPLLLVNDALENWRETVSSSSFRGLVYPAALRQVLWKAIVVDELADEEDVDCWQAHWIRFVRTLGLGGPPEDESERFQWIEDAVEAFSRKHSFLTHYEIALDGTLPT